MKKIVSSASFAFTALLLTASQVMAQTVSKSLNPCDNKDNKALNAACAGQGLGLGNVLGFVITIAFVIAVLIALFYLVWGGIKWITSGGDKAGVEGARSQIIASIIGLIIVFLAFFILNLVLGLFNLSLFDLELPTLNGK